MKKKLNMKILSAILAFVTFLSCCPIICLASGDFAITHEGKAITRISVDKQEKLEVTAESIPEGTYQWQIEVPGADLWVNIQGQSSATLGLSYALVGSLLDGDTATLRCVAISGGEEIACSTELRVTITDKPEEKIEKSSFVPVILGPAEAATEAPTEAATEAPTEAATEAPTEAATEAPTEAATEAPTEAATEAPTETATEAPTEAATEAPAEAATEAPTKAATEAPTEAATEAPTEAATEAPTEAATEAPTEAATEAPTEAATEAPAEAATEAPAEDATEAPTEPRRFMMFAAAPRSTEATEPAEANTVLVQVHFVRLKAGSTTELVNVYAPYPAELQKGTPYSAKIPVLDHLGYKPSCDEVEIQTEGKQKFIELNYAAVEEDINIYVMYKPDNVHYAARYFIQNPYDDLYTEYRYVEKEGLTDSYPEEELAIDIPGFTKLYTQPEYIAADGSTEFQVYYDRNYYLYIFNPDGGHGTDPVYARHGTYLQIPDPVKAGWNFAGWDLGVASYENGKVVYTYDGVEDTVDSHVNINEFDVDGVKKPYNKTYKALWAKTKTNYTVAYWIQDSAGNNTYIGSTMRNDKYSGDEVTGTDDLSTSKICGFPEDITSHDHSASCYKFEHTHTAECLTGLALGSSEPSAADNEAFAALGAGEPENGYIYTIDADGDSTTYYRLRLNDTWYAANAAMISGMALKQSDAVPGGQWGTRVFHAKKYYATGLACQKTASLICGHTHNHTNACNGSKENLTFKSAETAIVKGDGSTVVNVYYQYDTYTLKFYYAATTGGTDKNNNGKIDADEYDTVKILGGSTDAFANTVSADVETLLKTMYVNNSEQWGTVTQLPALNDEGEKRNYQTGADEFELTVGTSDEKVKFHYIAFSAKYAENISGMWPSSVFESATRTDDNTGNGWTGREAFVSGWTGEHYVKYNHNSNKTIKGIYNVLDDELLFDSNQNVASKSTISYLCFWENGAPGINWNAPELYIYHIWLPFYGTDEEFDAKPDDEKREKAGIKYTLHQKFEVCDNSFIHEQTPIAVTGYYEDYGIRGWAAYFIGQMHKNASGNYYVPLNDGEDKKYDGSKIYSSGWNYAVASDEVTVTGSKNGEYLLYTAEGDYMYDPTNPVGSIDHTKYREAYAVDFYYKSNPHRLYYRNYNKNMGTGEGAEVPFGKNLAIYGRYFTKDDMEEKYYPDTLEPGAYAFDGWYTSPEGLEGTEMDWSGTMPDADFTVYAKWVPEVYDISFSVTYTDTTGAEVVMHEKIKDVQHGMPMDTSVVVRITEEVSQKPPVEGAQFAGWFYEDSMGRIIAFDPENMAVTEGMRLFAQWRTPIPVDYTVRYLYRDLHDTSVLREFVDDEGKPVITTGKAYLATTKTFPAKVFEDGDKLYFPELGSQSIVIDSDPEKNVVTFIYKQVEDLYYTVKCWDNTEKKWLLYGESGVRIKTEKAVMDIQAPSIDGYLPTSAYERLYMSTDEEKNVVTFYYNKNVTEAHYVVHHMEQNLDGMLLYDDILTTDKVGTIDTTVSLELQNLEGFKFDPARTVVKKLDGSTYSSYTSNQSGVSAELPKEGLEIWLYYDRQLYSYIIQYLEVGTNKELGSKNGTNEKYGHELTLYTTGAEDSDVPDQLTIDGIDYLLKDGESVKTYIIRAENNQLVKYYYMPKTSVARYIAVTQGSGVPGGACAPVSETVNGEYLGSTPTANQGFYFAGWFKDNACTQLVTQADGEILTGSRLKPKYGQDGTFYALFKPYTLTIRQNGMKNEADSAIYDVIKGTNEVVARVMVTGNSSVTIQQISPGEYTVREVSGNWTWTYGGSDPVSRRVTVGEDANDVVFAYTHIGSCWLHGENCN